MPPVLDHGDVDVDNIALFQGLVAGDAVTDLVIDRSTDGLRIRGVARRSVIQWRWNGAK